MIKFRPVGRHPPGPTGNELPFIWWAGAPEHVFLGPLNSYHWELVQHTPELRDSGAAQAAALHTSGDLIEGRMTWPSKVVHIFGSPPLDAQRMVAQALGGQLASEQQEPWQL